MAKCKAVRAKRSGKALDSLLLAPCSLPYAKSYRPIARDRRGLLLGRCPCE
jgi:hypothetical protein